MNSQDNTKYFKHAKVVVFTLLNMRCEKIAFDFELEKHPYVLISNFVDDAVSQFKSFIDASFIENRDAFNTVDKKSDILEEKHEELWQEIWSRHNDEEFDEFIALKKMRLEINGLTQYVLNSNCVDMGCGNGSFSFALLESGAKSVTGIDFGAKQVYYANKISEDRGINNACFMQGDVFNTKLDSSSFDFGVSNGVFHHLSEDNMEKAVAEASRILKTGAWFWYYIDGAGHIFEDVSDRAVEVMKEIPVLEIEEILKSLNLTRNKMVHLMDTFSATYIHSTWNETVRMLERHGFKNIKRIVGGTKTDFDHDVIEKDPYGREKFGEGDLRIICQRG